MAGVRHLQHLRHVPWHEHLGQWAGNLHHLDLSDWLHHLF